ncbi:VOC family protein [Nocardia sp. NPDC048505]|uniref:VOC family protein n=1 Tax=Nocardia sp. NPDC048505 TaxID=3155756 RepID=UPI0033EA66BE
MSPRLTACTLVVHDLRAALDFYCRVLGFTLHETRPATASLGPPAQPDLRILLHAPAADPQIPAHTRHALRRAFASGLLDSRLVFHTDSCAATFERLEAAGAEVAQEPISRPGIRDCAFFDPSGNLLRFTERLWTSAIPGLATRAAVGWGVGANAETEGEWRVRNSGLSAARFCSRAWPRW